MKLLSVCRRDERFTWRDKSSAKSLYYFSSLHRSSGRAESVSTLQSQLLRRDNKRLEEIASNERCQVEGAIISRDHVHSQIRSDCASPSWDWTWDEIKKKRNVGIGSESVSNTQIQSKITR